MKIAIAQLNSTVGDIAGNLEQARNALTGLEPKTDLLVFPELFLTGCPPRDLLKLPWFIREAGEAVRALAGLSTRHPETGILVGAPIPTGKKVGQGLYNAAIMIYRGEILLEQPKAILPSHDISDEGRYFDPAPELKTIPFRNEVLGISISRDVWNRPGLRGQRHFPDDPLAELAGKGATIFINIAADPFTIGSEEARFRVLRSQARRHRLPLVFVNSVGGNDELIFDGGSLLLDRTGEAVDILPLFNERIRVVDTSVAGREDYFVPRDRIASLHDALVLGLRDYMKKCGFDRAVIGLSGGIDSAVTCSLAKEAVGGENVFGIAMPSIHTSGESTRLAGELVENLGISLAVIPISPIFDAYLRELGERLKGDEEKESLARENFQARIRGNILMGFSNRFGSLVLATGNKSESATGYCTLYGDLTGGLAVIADVPKTMVYQLAEFINREREIIPRRIIERPPSAELKPGQTDQDTLPPYPVLDRILFHLIEEERSAGEIIKLGLDPETVKWVVRAVNNSEYKRRQAPPGLKVTGKAFGSGRRMPIAAEIIPP